MTAFDLAACQRNFAYDEAGLWSACSNAGYWFVSRKSDANSTGREYLYGKDGRLIRFKRDGAMRRAHELNEAAG